LAGPKDENGEENDAFASFFGDDDFDWEEEDELLASSASGPGAKPSVADASPSEDRATPSELPPAPEGDSSAADDSGADDAPRALGVAGVDDALRAADDSGADGVSSAADDSVADELPSATKDADDSFGFRFLDESIVKGSLGLDDAPHDDAEHDRAVDPEGDAGATANQATPAPDDPPDVASTDDGSFEGPTFRLDAVLPSAGVVRSPMLHTHFDPMELDAAVDEAGVSGAASADLDHDDAGAAEPLPSLAGLVTQVPAAATHGAVWDDIVATLEAEASAVEGPARTQLLVDLARVHLRRRSDLDAARTAAATAGSAGASGLEYLSLLVDLHASRGEESAGLDVLCRLAACTDSEAAADLWRRASGITQRVHGTEAGLPLLQHAVEAAPGDLVSWWAIRDAAVAIDSDETRVSALQRIVALVDDTSAAVALRELGLVMSSLGRDDEALEVLQAARLKDASSGGVFRTLESLLLSRMDHESLAALYEDEAGRWEEEDAGWWWLLSARSHRLAGQGDRATQAYAHAVAQGSRVADYEQQAWLTLSERSDDLARAIAEQALRATSPEAAGAAWLRLAVVHELLRDQLPEALVAYRKAAAVGVGPARDAIGRLLFATGDLEALRHQLQVECEAGGDRAERAALQLAELHESSDPAGDEALAAYQQIVLTSESSSFALQGLARVARRRGEFEIVSQALSRLVGLADGSMERADLTVRRAMAAVGAGADSSEIAEAMKDIGRSSDSLGLDIRADILDAAGRFEEAAEVMVAIASNVSGEQAARRWFDVARVRRLHLGDRRGAVTALQQAIQLWPGFGEAREMLVELAGGLRPDVLLEVARAAAERGDEQSQWYRFMAATMATLTHRAVPELDEMASDDAAHIGFQTLWAIRVHAASDQVGIRSALEADGLDHVENRLAWVLSIASSDAERARAGLDELTSIDRAYVAAARVAERLGNLDAAVRFATCSEDATVRREAARLGRRRGDSADAVMMLAGEAASDPTTRGAVANLVVRAARKEQDPARLAAAHQHAGDTVESDEMRVAHRLLASELWSSLGDIERAGEVASAVIRHRAGSWFAFEMALASRELSQDAEGVAELFDASERGDAIDRAESLERAGSTALDAWEAALADDSLYPWLSFEAALTTSEAWQPLFDRLSARLAHTVSMVERGRIEGRRRWILAEKLADTDQALELYQRLHQDHPEDKEILESLARIAGARGDDKVAIGYLRQLAEGVTDPHMAARYQRRIAEVHLHHERRAEARQALLDALDHRPDDIEALQALKDLARQAEDWQALMSVLQREAAIATGDTEVELWREIAELTETHEDDVALAIDAWRRLLSVAPGDVEGQRRLLVAAGAAGDHELFLQVATELQPSLEGAARVAMLRQMGEANESMNRREDAIHWYEQAVASETPEIQAAIRLEVLYRAANDWQGVVRALQAQSSLLDEPVDRANRLMAAARVELDVRHDREAASRIFESVLDVDNYHQETLQFLVGYMFDAGRYVDAVPLCERLEPMLVKSQDTDDFDERMELSTFFFRYAEMLRSARRDDDALSRYESALELNPTHLPSLEAVGPLYVSGAWWEKAGEVFQHILQLTGGRGDPQTVAQTYTMLGTVERHRDNADKAYKRYNKALEIFPNHVPALRGLALILESRGDWNALLTVYNTIIYHATVPQDLIDAYLTKGRVLDEQLDRQDKSVQHYERSLSFYAHQPSIYLRLAELSARRASWEEVANYAVRGLEVADGEARLAADLQILLAVSRMGLGDRVAAEHAIEEAIRADGSFAEFISTDALQDIEPIIEGVRTRLPR
jgi:tetratricopeptide (TPR) repeat protein